MNARLILMLIADAIAVGVVFCVSIWSFGSAEVASALATAEAHGFLEQNTREILLHLALSACLWAMARLLMMQLGRLYKQRSEPRVVKLGRGTVLTETLIVFPVFLLLLFGLLQLTINNTAAMLTSLSAFQAGRTVYLWQPETTGSKRNGGLTGAQVAERARIAAASVVTPTAPSMFRESCDTSPQFEAKLAAFASVGIEGVGTGVGLSVSAIKGLAGARSMGTNRNETIVKGYDKDAFELRGPLKFYVAYCNTEASYSVSGGKIKTVVHYDLKQVMPMVGFIFGERRGLEAYTRISRAYELPTQIEPNPTPPRSFLSFLGGGINPFSSWE